MSVLHVEGTVLLGPGHERHEIWVEGGRVRLSRPASARSGVQEITGWAVPGLVDVHCHLGLGHDGPVTDAVTEQQATTDRDSGVLAVRDAGSPSDTRWVTDRPDLPRLVRASQHLARPRRYLRHYGLELDDPEELPRRAREQARAGSGWVKLVGDWIDRDLGEAGDLTPLWTREQLIGAVTAAHEEAGRVTVHTFATETIDDLLAAGVDGIEHGTGLLPEHLGELVRRGIPVTPTLLQVARFAEIADQAAGKYPRYAARMRHLHERRYRQVKMLHEAGVQLLVGTDAGGTIPHGQIARECAELVAAQVPAADVVAAATWQARRFLGLGDLVEGASADLVVFPADPRVDIRVLAHPKAIILRGALVRPAAS